ncbi:MAG: futalosine hydrolase [Planctomycetes bacterium]|nr:futalosine hydrolase [Planctomycetota bacterium]
MRLLVVTAVESEAKAVAGIPDVTVVVSGIGRTNAACATTEALITERFDAAISAGIAGALPEGGLDVGDAVVASQCVYAEEGLVTARGFAGVEAIGFALGDFAGNAVPVDPELLEALSAALPVGPVATVATCSGTDEQAEAIARRTGAVAEAMEGAAVVHAARRRGVPAIEVRSISNRTGDRAGQRWDLPRGLEALGATLASAVDLIRSSGLGR